MGTKIIISLLILTATFLNPIQAQIMLEHTYDSASTYSPSNQLMIIDFELSGMQYVRVNRTGKTISIYDLNHSLQKSFSYASFPQAANGIPTILYLSEQLFDPDPMIEFLYQFHDVSNNYYTSIYKEDGSLIFHEMNCTPMVMLNVHLQQYPIYNTPQGTKLILSCKGTMQAKVFSLPGSLSTSIHSANQYLLESGTGMTLGNAYPNPTHNSTTIDYVLPNDAYEGAIVFFNLEGKEIRRFRVDNTFNSLLVSTGDIPAGTYLYHLRVAGDASAAKRMVVIR